MNDPQDDVAAEFRNAAEKLERAAAPCRIAALHYTHREAPRRCAHTFAAPGDLSLAEAALGRNAEFHAGNASIDFDPGSQG